MKTNHEHFYPKSQRGNAMVYVLIAIVLFAALSMTLGRQTDTGEAAGLPEAKAEMYATQLIAYATAAKSSIEQMTFSGAKLDDLDFTLPSQAGFNNAPTSRKVYHPNGGGLNANPLPKEAIKQNLSDPVAGWYLGRFNNVEWTKTTAPEVVLVAYQINKKVCEEINKTATGSDVIPQLTDSIRETMIDDSFYTGGSNVDLTTDPAGSPICAACHNRSQICVEDQTPGTYAFYSVLIPQ
jgi:hypothetical protein